MSETSTNQPSADNDANVTQRISALSGVLDELRSEIQDPESNPGSGTLQSTAPQNQAPTANNEPASTIAFGASEDDEDSIESYMAALLERSGGLSSNSATEEPSPSLQVTQSLQPVSESPDVAQTSDFQPTASATVRLTEEELDERRRQATLEVRNTMPSLRELAVASTKSAIEQHDCEQVGRRVYAQAGLASGAIFASFGLLWATVYVPSLTFTCAILCSGITIIATVFFLFSLSRLRRILIEHEARAAVEDFTEVTGSAEQPA